MGFNTASDMSQNVQSGNALITSPDLLKVSPEFKKEVGRSILAIAGFILVYLILVALTIALVIACIYGGVWLITSMPKLIILLVGLGVISLGIMVMIFVFKFLFSDSSKEDTDSIEITEQDQPRLFAFIHQVAEETNTQKPKKIFLNADVNACVFYHSGFWSMFLPVKKNLKIGLGLVNSLSLSEFKAVIAHEFGHFSQRSMKLGSYVYHVNRIIYDMLYSNNGYGKILAQWARIHSVFAFFAQITVQIILGIQWILRQIYKVVNKSYLALSRQMEFHADLVASSVAGSNNIISALKRIEFSGACFQFTIEECNRILKENKITSDIYENQRSVIKHIAKAGNHVLENDLPVLNTNHNGLSLQRINFKDQWASHPTISERNAFLIDYDLYREADSTSAWVLFNHKNDLKKQLTDKVYESVEKNDSLVPISGQEFEKMYVTNIGNFDLPKIFKSFYDNRQISIFDPQDIQKPQETLEELISDENVLLPAKIRATEQDIEILKAITSHQIDVKSFDFDGQKYKSKKAVEVLAILEGELSRLKNSLLDLDKKIYNFFYHLALDQGKDKAEKLKYDFQFYFEQRKSGDDYLNQLNATLETLAPIYSGQSLPVEQIKPLIARLKHHHEPSIKSFLEKWIALEVFDRDAVKKQKILNFLKSDHAYFSENSFFDHELMELNMIIHETWEMIQIFLFTKFRKLLEMEDRLMINNPVQA